MSPLTVMKFGGSSVGRRLPQVVDLIASEHAKGPIAVVVSAMGDTTDGLIEAAGAASRGELPSAHAEVDRIALLVRANAAGVAGSAIDALIASLRQLLEGIATVREQTAQMLDTVMSFGERLSAVVLVDLLKAKGLPALVLDSRQWTVTDDQFGAARVDVAATHLKLTALATTFQNHLVVTTGFLGQTVDGRTTTLGRNGSDYTATLLARGLKAAEVHVWTDVPGVMTADPAIVPDAYSLERLSYMEALELASFGARMFHPRTMIPLIESGIRLRIRNTMQPQAAGTVIDAAGAADSNKATSVTSLEHLAVIGVECRQLSQGVRLGGRVLHALEAAGVTVWMATQSAHGQAVAVVVPQAAVAAAQRAIADELELEMTRGEVEPPRVRQPVTLLTLVAETMGQRPDVAGRFLHALGSVGINVHAIAQGASARSVSCVIEAADTAVAVRTVHATFHFAKEEVSVLVLGTGTVGSQLLAQIQAQQHKLAEEHGIAIRVVAVCDSKKVAWDGIAEPFDGSPSARRALLEKLRRLPLPVLVDCTAASGMEALYAEAFERGIHVVTANKKPLTLPWDARQALIAAARQHHRAFNYETTVGASLPVIGTLKDLIRTGDEVLSIEGCFSGTLGYLANELMKGVPLARAVLEARRLGYTEPNPQDDLSGLDVARKALILARELGLPLSLEEVTIEPFVPRELMAEPSLERFLEALAQDRVVAQTIETCRKEGKVLRYLARIEPSTRTVKVGPMALEAAHPATRLRGSEAFVAFTTARYQEYPLIVQGAGAGGAVTAAGVLADVLKIAQRTRDA